MKVEDIRKTPGAKPPLLHRDRSHRVVRPWWNRRDLDPMSTEGLDARLVKVETIPLALLDERCSSRRTWCSYPQGGR